MRVLIAFAIGAAHVVYAALKLLPVRRKVVFFSRQANEPSRDFSMLAEQLRRTDPSLEVVVRCKFIEPGLAARIGYLAEVLAQMYHLATASACVLDGYIVPVSVLSHRRSLVIVQMWHALGAIKHFGHQAVDKPGGRPSGVARAMRMHHNYDVVLCGAPVWVPAFAEAFGVEPSAVLPLGLPRADYLVASARQAERGALAPAAARLAERYPALRDRTGPIVLYAPTYRRNEPVDFEAVIAAFEGSKATLVIKPHDLESPSLDSAHVVDATGIDVLDLIVLADVIVTDYSAVAFEACAAGRPVLFYVADIAEYARDLGLNLDPLAELPEMTSTDIAEIARRIGTGDLGAEMTGEFCSHFGPPTDGGCTRRIADLVLSRIGKARSS